jgi:hypothetical protein
MCVTNVTNTKQLTHCSLSSGESFKGIFLNIDMVQSYYVFNEHVENKPLIATAFITVALALAAPTFVMNTLGASVIKTLTGTSVQTNKGLLTCPGGGGLIAFIPFLNAQVARTGVSGQITILDFFGGLGGSVNKAEISPNNFKISGIIPQFGDNACGQIAINTPATFSAAGQCGFGVTVQYADTSGVRATIPDVNVACQG